MTHFTRRAALAGLTLATVWPLRLPGQEERQVEGGIGGTGIVGVLTGFGSLYINGARVITDEQTAYSDGFGPLPAPALRVGDSLTVEATGAPLKARRVHVTHPLVGQITATAPGRITVNGVDVRLAPGQRGGKRGDRIAVSGLWRGAYVEASGLAPARSAQDLVSGDLSRRGGQLYVGSVPVAGRTSAQSGSFMTAVGSFRSGGFAANSLTEGRFTGAAGPLDRLSIEGYLEPIRQAPGYRISGLGHSFARSLNLAPFTEARVLFTGPYTGKFVAQQGVLLPNDPAQRRRLLRQMAQP